MGPGDGDSGAGGGDSSGSSASGSGAGSGASGLGNGHGAWLISPGRRPLGHVPYEDEGVGGAGVYYDVIKLESNWQPGGAHG